MVLDLPETPVLGMLQINGRLALINDPAEEVTDQIVHAHHIFIRAGEFLIGTEAEPF